MLQLKERGYDVKKRGALVLLLRERGSHVTDKGKEANVVVMDKRPNVKKWLGVCGYQWKRGLML